MHPQKALISFYLDQSVVSYLRVRSVIWGSNVYSISVTYGQTPHQLRTYRARQMLLRMSMETTFHLHCIGTENQGTL